MQKEDVEKQLKKLENCNYVNFHLENGKIYSCPPENVVVYLDDEYIEIPNDRFNFRDLSCIDSYY